MAGTNQVYSIYKATNLINGKCYIGFTNNFIQRKHGHKCSGSRKQPRQVFHKAIKEHGWENFGWEELYVSRDRNYLLNEMETYFIKLYKSHVSENGYNVGWGGENCNKTENKGTKTEAHRKKLSDHMKAINKAKWENPESRAYFVSLARNRSEESRKKMSENRKGIPVSEETKKKLSIINTGKKHSEATKKKMSESNRVRKHTEETKQKLSQLLKGRVVSPETRKKSSELNLGKKHTEQSKLKMSLSRRKYGN